MGLLSERFRAEEWPLIWGQECGYRKGVERDNFGEWVREAQNVYTKKIRPLEMTPEGGLF